MSVRVVRAILEKDVLSLLPLVSLTAMLFLADPIIVRLDLLPIWAEYNAPVVLVAVLVLALSVIQLDSPASLNDDWLCRPVSRSDLVTAKLVLLCAAVYLPRAIGTFVADLVLGYPIAEALLDALLLSDKLLLFLLPIFLLSAVVTRTFVQGFGALFAIFICVFVIPTPFMRDPGPLDVGLREGLTPAGIDWLGTMPARLASLALLAAGVWLAYWHRRLDAARALLGAMAGAMVLAMMLPMMLLPWNSILAVQQAAGPAPAAETASIYLHPTRTCFPAARPAELATDPSFVAAERDGNDISWHADVLRSLGPDAIAFLTRVEPRNLPLDWRVKLNHVAANYSADGVTLYSLRPATYITDKGGGGPLTHSWLLPPDAVKALLDVEPELVLEYSFTLLVSHGYSVPTDGKRHRLPGLGYCSAGLDSPGNRIEVDCFSAVSHPAQITAELNEIPASRVQGRADFAPGFAQWPYGKRVKLMIGSPRLARHDSITVTAWTSAAHFQKALTLPGILGADLETCPLPVRERNGLQKASWRDAAPHAAHSVSVDEGVQLEVLDFGGEGSPILLLPGLGATAHSYDELAPRLAEKHRVIAMTRRGAGASSKPDFGFETPRLAQDVLRVMDAMRLEKALLVGHSIAGDELTWLGGNHPDRFSGLVYLDAAYDRSGDPRAPQAMRMRELGRAMPPEPPLPPQALLNYDTMTRVMKESGRVRLPEGELIEFFRVSDPYYPGSANIDSRTQQAISAAIEKPDYARLKIPALAIYAIPDPDAPLPPWFDPTDEALIARVAELSRLRADMRRSSMEQFKRGVARGQVLELPNATHYLIQTNQDEVLAAIEAFAASN